MRISIKFCKLTIFLDLYQKQLFVLCLFGTIGYKWRYIKLSGGRLNKKDGLTRYGDSHVKDKTS